jgi:hypothetical protein
MAEYVKYKEINLNNNQFKLFLVKFKDVKSNFNSTGIKDIEHIDDSDEEFDQETLVVSSFFFIF